MKQLLCLVCCLVTLQSFSQVSEVVLVAETGDSGQSTVSYTPANKLILQKYCNETIGDQTDSTLSSLYQQPVPNLKTSFDPRVVSIYNPTLYQYHFYPANRKPNVETSRGRASGLFYGGAYRDSFNPYGASGASQAILLGTLNYLVNRKY